MASLESCPLTVRVHSTPCFKNGLTRCPESRNFLYFEGAKYRGTGLLFFHCFSCIQYLIHSYIAIPCLPEAWFSEQTSMFSKKDTNHAVFDGLALLHGFTSTLHRPLHLRHRPSPRWATPSRRCLKVGIAWLLGLSRAGSEDVWANNKNCPNQNSSTLQQASFGGL